ncbi:MAG: hypothetical protein M1524_01680 [Patescibacteria group bacterium]|nr:hypothetical protein [Patescibacteria group bacterium]
MPDIFTPKNQTTTTNSNTEEHKSVNPRFKHHHPGFFTSFQREPDGVNFRDQDENEKILLFLRAHFAKNLSWILITLVLLAVPVLILFLSPVVRIIPAFIPENFIIFFVVFYYVLVFNYTFVKFITWHYNISLVTNERIVDIDFYELVYHNVAMTKLELVEDVSYTQVGFFATLFNYGDVIVQTAGEIVHFDFLAVINPSRVVGIINELIGKKGHAR